MIDASIWLPAFLLGLMGSAHCIGMCGGIGAALGAARGQPSLRFSLAYNIGRVLSYALLGAVIGGAADLISQPLLQWLPQGARWLRVFAGLMVVAMGFYVAGWWRGLAQLERIGALVWRRVRPLTKSLLPPRSAGAALTLGALWGLLPCGLVYSSLTWALLNADAARGAQWMAAFGCGTLPAMLATTHGGSYLRRWAQRPRLRQGAALVLIAAGIVAMALPFLHAQHAAHDHSHHAMAARENPGANKIAFDTNQIDGTERRICFRASIHFIEFLS